MRWQSVAKILGPSAVGILLVLAGILNLSGMSHSVPPDIVCSDCYSEIQVNSTYWEIKVEHAGDKDILFKKMSRSRTLWLNLDKVSDFIPTNPEVFVEILVPTVKRFSTVKHPEFGYLRPLKDGDALIARKNKYNPNGDRFIVHGKTDGQTVKWGLEIESILSEGIEFDPIWQSPESFELIKECTTETKERWVSEVNKVLFKCNETNVSCVDDYYVDQTTYKSEEYLIEVCEELGIRLNGKETLYTQSDKNCLRTENTFCCWLHVDGGNNFESRKGEARVTVYSGESGKCIDLNDNKKILATRTDSKEVSLEWN